jgi:hypothetical protein
LEVRRQKLDERKTLVKQVLTLPTGGQALILVIKNHYSKQK